MNTLRQNASAMIELSTMSRRILSILFSTFLSLGPIAFESHAQETKPTPAVPSALPKVPDSPTSETRKIEGEPSVPVAPPSLAPASTNSTPPELPVVGVPLAARSPVNQYLTREKVDALQERIRPSVQNIEARGGAVRFLWSQRHQPSSMLQLINPFAPTEYGVSSVSPNQIPASVAPGQPPLPRGLRDDRTHEANGTFFRSGW